MGVDPFLSVVIPAWNEAARIGECLTALDEELSPWRPELIVVDDGSTDGTAAAAVAWMRRHRAADARLLSVPHGGKGHAVYAGVAQSRGAAVAYIDADLDIPAAEIARLVRLRLEGGLDVCVGSKRRLTWRGLPRPLWRKLASLGLSALVRLVYRLPVRDTQTGVKVFPGAWLRAVARHARLCGFLFDVELLAVAAADGLRIEEVPVAVRRQRPAGRLGGRDVLRSLVELIEIGASVRRIRLLLHSPAGAVGGVEPARKGRALWGTVAGDEGARVTAGAWGGG